MQLPTLKPHTREMVHRGKYINTVEGGMAIQGNGKWWGYNEYEVGGVDWEFVSTCASSCALICPHVTNLTDMPPPGASLGTPGDRQHVDKQAFPWHPSTRGQTT